jgi:alkylation response protein AidB-like acyl-CoA dehydrogenase
MNFELTDDQLMMRETFARFLDEESSMVRVRAAMPSGFDAAMWKGLAELGAFMIRVPEAAGGLGLGVLDATVLMEEAGRMLASGPVAEALVAARLLGTIGDAGTGLLEKVTGGEAVATIAFHDIAQQPSQWIAGGLVADGIIALRGDDVVLLAVGAGDRIAEDNLASTPIAEIDLSTLPATVLGSGNAAKAEFAKGIEEWKLLMSAALSGLSREALRLAAAYAVERKAFGQPIGAYQAISHPMADLLSEIDSGQLLIWKSLRAIADGEKDAAATVSATIWWNAITAARTVAHALHTFGGYGLTTEYDIFLYNLRAKAWPLVMGDPADLLVEAGARLYGDVEVALPDVGEVAIEFDLGDGARAMVSEIDAFFEKNFTKEIAESTHYSWEGHNPGFHKQLAQAGLLFLNWPKDMGGRDIGVYAQNAAMEAFERWGWNNPVANVASMVAFIIHRYGSDELKQDVLPKIMAGEEICSLGYSEPGSGSDVFAAQTKATPNGNGWKIEGTKMFTSGANLTDWVLMLTRTDQEAAKHKGLTMFLVPLKAEGVTVQPVHTFQDERTNITFYDNVHIPDSYRIGAVNGGARTMAGALELEHGGGFAKSMRPAVEAAEELAREIKRGDHRLIDEPQAQARLARAYMDVVVADLLTWRSLWSSKEKKHVAGWGPMAKMFTSECFQRDTRDLLDLTAPLSLSKRKGAAARVDMAYRHSQGTTIYGGTSEVHRSMIAEKALGLPRTRG